MGKSTTPTKWFKAVKKAFRSPSKDKPSPKDKGGDAGDEKPLNKQDFPPVSYAAPTPHPLPSFEGVAHNRNESQQQNHGPPPPPALPTTPDPAMTDKKPKEVEEPEQQHSRNGNGNGNVYGVEKHQEDNNDSALSEEDKAAARIQQRFLRNPLALKGLIRLQALVRGQLVRRQAAITLRTMEAIVRVQALFRGRRVRMSKDGRAVKSCISRIQRLSSRVNGDARREGFQGMEPETSEAEHEANKRKRRTAYQLTQQLKRSTPNRSSSFIDCDPDQPHEGWAWLELWTNAKAWESRQLEAAKLDSKDYIEIIPGSSRRTSDYPTTVKEVDFHTLNQVKYHENGNGNGFSHSNPISPMDGKSTVSDSQKKGFFSPKKSTYGSPHLTTPSPAASQDAAAAAAAAASPDGIPPSPNSPEASVKSNFADEEEASLAMEHLVLPEAANGSTTPSDSFSTSNGLHDQPAGPGLEDTLNGEAPAFKVVNGGIIPENVNHHQDNGEDGTQTHPRKEFESPVPVGSMPRPTCRYMSATASAKAKFRQSSNPKNRTAGATTPELANEASPSPVAAAPPPRKQRKSVGGGTTQAINVGNAKAAQSPNKTPVAFGTGKTTNRRNPSPKTIALKEKPRSVDVGHDGVLPIHRNSWGNGDDKRWRT